MNNHSDHLVSLHTANIVGIFDVSIAGTYRGLLLRSFVERHDSPRKTAGEPCAGVKEVLVSRFTKTTDRTASEKTTGTVTGYSHHLVQHFCSRVLRTPNQRVNRLP